MISRVELALGIDEAQTDDTLRALAAGKLAIEPHRIRAVRLLRRSLDARGTIKFRLQCDVYLDEDAPPIEAPARGVAAPGGTSSAGKKRVVIIGCGPAGMFAALRLIEAGIAPIILERGKDVQARRRDLAKLTREGIVDPDSNYGFGEGGAGTYSDGKLYTRVKDKALIARVLRTLVAHGAHPDILIDAHPHIGSNKLPAVVAAMRQSIIESGGEIRFENRVVDFVIGGDGRLRGAVTAAGEEVTGDAVILAAGHSARELFELLHQRGIRLEAKPFAMGLRIEHPQPLIDAIQYRGTKSWRAGESGTPAQTDSGEWRHPLLPAAAYRLAATVEGRGVFSFCMCPGGWIVPAATAPGEVVVNGMSLSRRDSPYANSGIVVAIETADLAPCAAHGELAGLHYQRSLETMASEAGGGRQRAPGQRLTDFLANRVSASLPASSYQPGLTSAPLHDLLPAPLASRLAEGLSEFGGNMRGYITEEAVLVGVESRTSSPVRIPRDEASLQHPEQSGLYPCGEGAGYAGGIVSAAIDGLRVGEACAAAIGAI